MARWKMSGEIDIVNVFRRAESAPVVESAIRIGAKVFGCRSGVRNEEAAERAAVAGWCH